MNKTPDCPLSRRKIIISFSSAAVTTLAGCSGEQTESASESDTKPAIEIRPKNPQVGQDVEFIANIKAEPYDDYDEHFYFWSFSDDMSVDKIGRRTKMQYSESGRYIVRLLAAVDGSLTWTEYDDSPSSVESLEKFAARVPSDEFSRHSRSITVSGLPDQQINLETQRLNLLLKAQKRVVPVDEPAILDFSAANLDSNRTLQIRLLIEIPTNLSVKGTTFEEGQGQYIANFNLSPGEVLGESIQIKSNSAGSYSIRGQTVYSFKDGSQSSESQKINIRFNN